MSIIAILYIYTYPILVFDVARGYKKRKKKEDKACKSCEIGDGRL